MGALSKNINLLIRTKELYELHYGKYPDNLDYVARCEDHAYHVHHHVVAVQYLEPASNYQLVKDEPSWVGTSKVYC